MTGNEPAQMQQSLEDFRALQKQSCEIKKWLVEHPKADPVAINEQRRRLKEILNQLIQTV